MKYNVTIIRDNSQVKIMSVLASAIVNDPSVGLLLQYNEHLTYPIVKIEQAVTVRWEDVTLNGQYSA